MKNRIWRVFVTYISDKRERYSSPPFPHRNFILEVTFCLNQPLFFGFFFRKKGGLEEGESAVRAHRLETSLFRRQRYNNFLKYILHRITHS